MPSASIARIFYRLRGKCPLNPQHFIHANVTGQFEKNREAKQIIGIIKKNKNYYK